MIDTRPINVSERLIGFKEIENGVRLIMWDGFEIGVYLEGPKARITFVPSNGRGGHGFQLTEEQTEALRFALAPLELDE